MLDFCLHGSNRIMITDLPEEDIKPLGKLLQIDQIGYISDGKIKVWSFRHNKWLDWCGGVAVASAYAFYTVGNTIEFDALSGIKIVTKIKSSSNDDQILKVEVDVTDIYNHYKKSTKIMCQDQLNAYKYSNTRIEYASASNRLICECAVKRIHNPYIAQPIWSVVYETPSRVQFDVTETFDSEVSGYVEFPHDGRNEGSCGSGSLWLFMALESTYYKELRRLRLFGSDDSTMIVEKRDDKVFYAHDNVRYFGFLRGTNVGMLQLAKFFKNSPGAID